MVEERPWPPAVGADLEAEGEDHGEKRPEEPEATVPPPDDHAHDEHTEEPPSEVGRRRSGHAGEASEQASLGHEELCADRAVVADRVPEVADGVAELSGDVGAPDRPGQVGRAGGEEPDGVGEQAGDDEQRHPEADDRMSEPSPDLRPVCEPAHRRDHDGGH